MSISPPLLNEVPHHIAIIMDGNGRWAKKNGLSRIKGHHEGVQSVRAVIQASVKAKIKFVTLYTFSTENWNRPISEVNGLMELFVASIKEYSKDLHENNIRFCVMGEISKLPKIVQKTINKIENETADYTSCTLILALNYGSRNEITHAVRLISSKIKSGELNIEDINEDTINDHLYLPDIPNPELMIRTSGEMRLSNFMLWQLSYSEIIITDTLWPDFREKELYDALIEYNSRNRRFGEINT